MIENAILTCRRYVDRTSIVTGAASGIGRASALRLGQEGSFIVAIDRDTRGLELTANRLRNAGVKHETITLDLLNCVAIAEVCESLMARHRHIDCLVNCAGIVHISGSQESPFFEGGLNGWDDVIGVNVKAVAALGLGLAEALKSARGAIVNVSSEAAYRARHQKWIYDASKAALLSVTRSMAAAFAPYGVRVVGIAPGGTITEMHVNDFSQPEEGREKLRKATAGNLLKRMAVPEEIAAAIAFLGSTDASFMTGTTVSVDGGGAGSR